MFQPDAQGISVNYDILGLTYWMLSRQEEVGRPERDEHQRFPAAASHALRHGYLERPVVDEWLAILGQAINRVWPQFPRQRSTFSMRISHDVDWPSRYGFSGPPHLMRMMLSDLINGRSMREVLRAPFIRMATRHQLLAGDPNNTFDWIMDLSDRHGLTSAFYFICGRTNPGMDATYELGHPAIRALLRRIHARGHEIGLHPSYHTYRDPHAFAREASYLRQICAEEGISQLEWGGRMHILRWETPTTLRNWESVGMHYDSTLSYADRPGFRCGTCFEYPAFDPVEQAALNLRIRPLIAMECTIMAPRYLGLGTGDAAHEKFRQLKDACRSVAGCFTLLWHNSEFETEDKRRLYAALLH
ncbi:hypothetical protein GSY71_10585 [Pusillimonas sp. TS35]|nr:hypothetical protein [Pusillimonas sp. TS35]